MKQLIWDSYLFTDTDSALCLALEMHEFAAEAGDKKGQAAAVNIQGICHDLQGNYESALKLSEQTLELNKQTNNPIGVSAMLSNIGLLHYKLGHIDQALSSHTFAAQKLALC